MHKRILAAAAACLLCAVLPAPLCAEETADTELTIDLSDLEFTDENGDAVIDLSTLFGDGDEEDMDEDDAEEYAEDLFSFEEETDMDWEDEAGEETAWYVIRYHDIDHDAVLLNEVIINLPADWTGEYDMLVGENSVDFYHTASRAAYYLDGYDGGRLFSLCTSPDESYLDHPNFQDVCIGSDGLYYYLTFPTDMQAYAEDDEIRDAYQKLHEGLDYIKEETFTLEDLLTLEDMTEEEAAEE